MSGQPAAASSRRAALSDGRPCERGVRPDRAGEAAPAPRERPDHRLLDGAIGQALGRRPGAGEVAVVIGRRTAIGDRVEAGHFLRADGGLDQRVAWRVDGEWRPGKGSEQRREHRRAA